MNLTRVAKVIVDVPIHTSPDTMVSFQGSIWANPLTSTSSEQPARAEHRLRLLSNPVVQTDLSHRFHVLDCKTMVFVSIRGESFQLVAWEIFTLKAVAVALGLGAGEEPAVRAPVSIQGPPAACTVAILEESALRTVQTTYRNIPLRSGRGVSA